MDDALAHQVARNNYKNINVLILVVMDDALARQPNFVKGL